LIVVGDRVFTDVVMANRMRGGVGFNNMSRNFTHRKTKPGQGSEPYQPNGPLAIWTTDVWKKEATGMRWLERKLVEVAQRWTKDAQGDRPDTAQFVRGFMEPEPLSASDIMAELFRRIRRV
jgi:phosphatidylglycerophosphatase GEP4